MGVCAHQVGKKIKKNLRGKEKLISTLFFKKHSSEEESQQTSLEKINNFAVRSNV